MSKKQKNITIYIKTLYLQAGLKQYEFAKKIGMDKEYISTLVNRGDLNIDFFVKISNHFDVTVKQLISEYYEDN